MVVDEDVKTQGSGGISSAVNPGHVGTSPGGIPPPPPITKSSKTVNPGLDCDYEGCGYKTPRYSGPNAIEALRMHIMTKHPTVHSPATAPSQLPPTIPGLEALVPLLQHIAVRPERACCACSQV